LNGISQISVSEKTNSYLRCCPLAIGAAHGFIAIVSFSRAREISPLWAPHYSWDTGDHHALSLYPLGFQLSAIVWFFARVRDNYLPTLARGALLRGDSVRGAISRGDEPRGFGIFTTPPGVVLPIFAFSREGEDFGKFSPIFPSGGYYRNPVIF